MSSEIDIRPVSADDYSEWAAMWTDYCAFYEATVPNAVTAATWTRILDPASPINALFAVDANGQALGFANYILHPYTWSERSACLLDDLFVRPEVRGQGTASQLIAHLVAMGREQNWGRIYWMTHKDNATARRVYNRFCAADAFVRYSLSLDSIHTTAGTE